MEHYYQVELHELLNTFECAFSTAWETCDDIEAFVEQAYDGDIEQFLFDVAHSCDYFSMAPVLRDFIEKYKS